VTDRIPLDHLTSDQLDALYERLIKAEQETTATATAAAHLTSLVLDRAERAEAAITRARALHRRNANTGDCEHCSERDYPDYAVAYPCPTIRALDEPAPGPAATQAPDGQTRPEEQPMPTVTTGLVVQPYRNDRGEPAWVFRCWGTDTCDGWLSLDHSSEQSAQRARDRHVAEEHEEPTA
jgi:hypothetical protein